MGSSGGSYGRLPVGVEAVGLSGGSYGRLPVIEVVGSSGGSYSWSIINFMRVQLLSVPKVYCNCPLRAIHNAWHVTCLSIIWSLMSTITW